MPSQAKAKKSPNGQPGRRNPNMRGSQRRDRTAKVLSEADHAEIIGDLRRFTPLCAIAAKLNVARHTLEDYVHATPELESELNDRDEAMVDMAERSLFDMSLGNVQRDKDGRARPVNVNAAIFLLERKGKTRGYSQHVEVEHAEVPTFTFSRSGSKVQAEAEDAKT